MCASALRVVCDCDGVLVDYKSAFLERLLAKYGGTVHPDEGRFFFGMDAGLAKKKRQDIDQSIVSSDETIRDMPVYEGMIEVLNSLMERECDVTVVTGLSPDRQDAREANLRTAGLRPDIEVRCLGSGGKLKLLKTLYGRGEMHVLIDDSPRVLEYCKGFCKDGGREEHVRMPELRLYYPRMLQYTHTPMFEAIATGYDSPDGLVSMILEE